MESKMSIETYSITCEEIYVKHKPSIDVSKFIAHNTTIVF